MYLQTEKDNFCNYYVLPFLKVNKEDFGGNDNFINSYINNKYQLLIQVRNKDNIRFYYFNNSNYITSYHKNEVYNIIFSIPSEFHLDVDKFIMGEYSKFSHKAKEAIMTNSGLRYKKVVKGVSYTHFILLILEKSKKLREQLEKELDIKINPESELASKPHKNNFYSF